VTPHDPLVRRWCGNGLWLNSVVITNGPAASRGTYVGTVKGDSASVLNWIFGDIAAGVWLVISEVELLQPAASIGDCSR
jgi:hypothetical protein